MFRLALLTALVLAGCRAPLSPEDPMPHVPIPLGPFDGGLNSFKTPYLLGPGEAVECANVDTSAGTLRGIYGPGPALTFANLGAQTATSTSLWYFQNQQGWAPYPGANDAVPSLVSYRFDAVFNLLTTNATVTTPANASGIIGAPVPSTPAINNGASGYRRSYAITFVVNGWESNPNTALMTVALNAGSSFIVPTAPLFSGSDRYGTSISVNVYATDPNDASGVGTLYKIASAANAQLGSTFTDSGQVINKLIPLAWGPNGYAGDSALDHTAPPAGLAISNGMQSATGPSGAGILFGASGQTARWTKNGQAGYWPLANAIILPEQIYAIVSAPNETYYLGAAGIYALSGLDANTITCRRTLSHLGVIPGCGLTATMTPYGLLFLSREGLTLFDGYRSHVITQNLLDPQIFTDGYCQVGAYQDRRYFLLNGHRVDLAPPSGAGKALPANGALVFDLSNIQAPRVTYFNAPLASDANCQVVGAHVTQATVQGNPAPLMLPGLHVLGASGNIYPWRPADGTNLSSRSAWSWKTGAQTGGTLARQKRFARLKIDGVGPVKVSVFVDPPGGPLDDSAPQFTKSLTLPADSFVLPNLTGRAAYILIAGGATAEVFGGQLDCEVQDGV